MIKKKIDNYDKKILSNSIEIFLKSLTENGNNFFAITINFEKNFSNIDDYKNSINILFNLLKNETKFLTCLHVVCEKNKSNKDHFHIFLSIKNIIDYNVILKNNVNSLLRNHYNKDVVIKTIGNLISAKKWIFDCMYKDVFIWEKPPFFIIQQKDQQIFSEFLDFFSYTLQYQYNVNTIVSCFYYEHSLINFNNYSGCILKKNNLDKKTIIDLILYYMLFNSLYIYNDSIYQKLENTEISYKKLDTIHNHLYKNFKENIIHFFLKNFNTHFDGLDFHFLIKNFLKQNKSITDDIKNLTNNKILPTISLVEFKDCIYSIKYNKIIPKQKFREFVEKNNNKTLNQVSTLKYYNKKFKHLNKPN